MPEAPIEIVAYDPAWPVRFEEEAGIIGRVLSAWLVGAVEHIGSTAVPGVDAKPVIDIMGGVRTLEASRPAIAAAANIGYVYSPYRPQFEHWFCKPSFAFRTHHLHLIPIGGDEWRRTLAFRDYLREHPGDAAEYVALKRRLAETHRHDREGYTAAKRPFIERLTDRAVAMGFGKTRTT